MIEVIRTLIDAIITFLVLATMFVALIIPVTGAAVIFTTVLEAALKRGKKQ